MADDASPGGVVLVVEDDAAVAALLHEALSELGHAAVVCRDAEEALACVRVLRPRAVLLDLRLPGMDGWEFARRFRLAFGEATPLVVVSALAGLTAEAVAARVPNSRFLPKPFELDDLARALDGAPGPRP